MLEEYRFVQRFRVPFGDVDMMHHVNNVAYIRWAETIRSDYFLEVLGAEILSPRGMIMANLTIDYEATLSYRENVAIGCKIDRFGTKSFDFVYEIWSADRRQRVAKLRSAMVAMDYSVNRSFAVPDEWRRKIEAFEAATP
jgi:acyl-CoA thioester hydrolase